MNRDQLIELLLNRFQINIAKEAAAEIVTSKELELLYELSRSTELPKQILGQVNFRAAYVLEYIFEKTPERFAPFEQRFLDDFALCGNDSAKRHFSKIMAALLPRLNPSDIQCQAIAECCLDWAADSRIRVAVKIWAVEVLIILSQRVDWIETMLVDLLEVLARDPSPAIACRLRRWRSCC